MHSIAYRGPVFSRIRSRRYVPLYRLVLPHQSSLEDGESAVVAMAPSSEIIGKGKARLAPLVRLLIH
jgi:hypothetical protein